MFLEFCFLFLLSFLFVCLFCFVVIFFLIFALLCFISCVWVCVGGGPGCVCVGGVGCAAKWWTRKKYWELSYPIKKPASFPLSMKKKKFKRHMDSALRVRTVAKGIWDLPCLQHLLFWFHVSNYRNFWNNERWKSCIKYFRIMKLFHLQKPL